MTPKFSELRQAWEDRTLREHYEDEERDESGEDEDREPTSDELDSLDDDGPTLADLYGSRMP